MSTLAKAWKGLARHLRSDLKLAGHASSLQECQLAQLRAKYRKEVQALTDERDSLKDGLTVMLEVTSEVGYGDVTDALTIIRKLASRIGRQRSANRKLQQAYDAVTRSWQSAHHQWRDALGQIGELKDQLRVACDEATAAQAELERRTEWSNAELAKLTARVAELEEHG